MTYRQPDYENWPEGEYFDTKRHRLESLQWEYDTVGTLIPRDFQYLIGKNQQFWCLLHFVTEERIRLETEVFARDMEIADLKAKLEQTNGN